MNNLLDSDCFFELHIWLDWFHWFRINQGSFWVGCFLLRAWSKFSSGQAATIISFSHSKKRSIGGFLFLLISLWALSLTALSCLISDSGMCNGFSFLAFLEFLFLSTWMHCWNFSSCYDFSITCKYSNWRFNRFLFIYL